ncbi:anthocyanidin 3-O-glucosyltransferase 7-like [Glycine soja]|uniref:Glycosyltransferase n=1 Tax=Glycine soja TaxID=3848 RepID=A0A0B2SPV7_GLYSO|nr:anthocyanidin 3-O-glucosyltransferase 7-like [Glycine soja]KHN46247.1 Kaempferol 3-O-beta-D-galactosyltransferase [Glycine soja]RZB95618.1 Kaempferol 3-O-beta-D-galactosyltransferase [Glycine soja]
MDHQNKHVAVFAFPFGSHLMPLLNLVLKLAHSLPNCSFSFIGTDKSNAILFPKPHIPNNIKAYSISDGIPEGHVLGKNPTEKLNLFLQTGPENLHKGIELAEAETKKRVTCIVADAFVTSSLFVAQTLNVPWIALWLPNSCSLSLYFYTELIRQHCANHAGNTTLDFLPGLSKLRVEDMPQDLLDVGEKETVFARELNSLGKVLPQAKVVVMNFFEELEPPLFVQDMRSKLQSLLYVVPLPSTLLPPSDTDSSGCLSWLDTKNSKSVAYVCFGTVVAPPPHELVAVAEALEESGFPFLWSLKEGLIGLLPNGFVERTKKHGKIVSWAPQTQVLAHDSVGVFVTHCGANSVIESVSSGVPMICKPFFGDQVVAARVIEDVWEIGVIMEGKVFTKNGLVKSLDLILVNQEGKKIRDNALKVKKTVEDAGRPEGQAAQDFDTLVEVISRS